MADVKLKDIGGEEKTYSGIKHVKIPSSTGEPVEFDLEATVQEKSVEIVQNGTTEVMPDAGYDGLSKVTITTNVPSSGGETEEVTVALSMADGNQVIVPSAGKSISKATITKPVTLIPENVAINTDIGGVVGVLDPYAISKKFIADSWSDDDVLCENGFGIARFRQHGVEIQIWADVSDPQLPLDDGYEVYFSSMQPWNKISNTTLSNRVAAFCENLVANKNSEFNSIFTGATKACFMDDEHPVDIPVLTASTPATTDGFMSVLKNVLVGFPSFVEYGFMEPKDYGENISDGGQIQHYQNAFMPFIWYPAVEDGDPVVAYYNLQDPTGTMATYENGFKAYNITGVGNLGYVNAIPATGVTSNFIALISNKGGILWWSDGAQTVPSAFLQNMDPSWTGGDVSLVAGWNITTEIGEGTNTTAQMPEGYKTVFWLEPNGIPLSEMDSYEKSIFAGVTKQPYKRLNQNHVSITFVLRNNSQ